MRFVVPPSGKTLTMADLVVLYPGLKDVEKRDELDLATLDYKWWPRTLPKDVAANGLSKGDVIVEINGNEVKDDAQAGSSRGGTNAACAAPPPPHRPGTARIPPPALVAANVFHGRKHKLFS